MGIKMAVATDIDGHDWHADTYVKGRGREPFHCHYCPVSVIHQNAYSCERHNKSVLVPAYFRLLKGGEHADGCRHDVEQHVKKLVTPSEGLIESIRNGKYRLRLMMIADALGEAQKKPAPIDGGGKRAASGTVYRRRSGSLPACINSAKKVLLLRAACDDDESIEQYLQLVFEGDTVVPWSSFYFEAERYMEAFTSVRLQTVQHPIALHGIVKSINHPVIDGAVKHVINLHVPKYTADGDDPAHWLSVEASVWTRHADWFAGIVEGDEIVVLGVWKAKAGVRGPAKQTSRYHGSDFTTHKLSLEPQLMAQIAKVPKNR